MRTNVCYSLIILALVFGVPVVVSAQTVPGFSLTIEGTRQGVYTIKLTNAAISEIKQHSELVDGRFTMLEDVSFIFQAIEVQDPGTKTMAVDNMMVK